MQTPFSNDWNETLFRVNSANLLARTEQLKTRLQTYPLLVLTQMAIQPFVVWLLWGQAGHGFLLLWLGGLYVLHGLELLKWRRDQLRISTVPECRGWSRYFTLMALVIGLAWASLPFYGLPQAFHLQVLLICIFLGLAAGSVTMNAVHLPSLFAYLAGLLLPLILRIVQEDDEAHRALAYMLTLFLGIMLAAGNELNRLIHKALEQRFENQALAERLARQKGIAEQAQAEAETANELLRDKGKLLEGLVQERTAALLQKTQEVMDIQDVMIMAMCSLAESRDSETGNHIRRTQHYVRTLAEHLRDHPKFCDFLDDNTIDILFKVAPLHDIGKVGIPDHILLKPGKLTAEEFEIMKTHAVLGGRAIMASEVGLSLKDNEFLSIARQIASHHHEKWDGSGYPEGLRGDSIPIPARLMALADVYDALISRRVYKEAFAQVEVESIIREGRGRHFDPDIADAFFELQPRFQQIAAEFRG